jgi:hypothetical protein
VQTFWDFFWFLFWAMLWIVWLMLLFRVFGDIFRSEATGWAKAAWTVCVLVLPYLGVFIYLIAEGDRMAGREAAARQKVDQARRDYIRSAAGTGGTADELERLASLRERGVLSDAEFEAQKQRILA